MISSPRTSYLGGCKVYSNLQLRHMVRCHHPFRLIYCVRSILLLEITYGIELMSTHLYTTLSNTLIITVLTTTHYTFATPRKPDCSYINNYNLYTGVLLPTIHIHCITTSFCIPLHYRRQHTLSTPSYDHATIVFPTDIVHCMSVT